MVSVTKQNTPALRFDGFDGEWHWAKLGDFGRVGMNKRIFKHQTSPTGDIPFYKIGTFGKTPDAFIPQSLYDAYRAKYPHPSAGTVLISASGSIGRTLVYDGQPAYFQDSNIIWLDHNGELLNSYLEQFYSIANWNGIEGTTIRRLYNEQFLAVPIPVPPALEEQQAIGELFADLDALIEQRRAKHKKLQQTKTALMQRMFPQGGADEPELRLDGFSGAWEIQPFSDLVAYRGHNSLSRADLTDVPTSAMNIHYGDILVKYDSVVDVSQTDIPFVRDVERLSNLSRQSLSDGDILFADAAEDSTVGKCVEVQGISDNLVLAGLHTISARPIRTFAPGFLGHALNAPSFHNQLLSKMQGTKVSSISISTLAETVFSFPTPEEQRAIGEVFSNLDALIAAESQYITQLTQAKTALLQRMFV
ncbi:restriction endonuclease subunit S [Corynebacterium diphtheriae]|nr:restriction endonuclease subunit S [Corynebacterium diphtheriae]